MRIIQKKRDGKEEEITGDLTFKEILNRFDYTDGIDVSIMSYEEYKWNLKESETNNHEFYKMLVNSEFAYINEEPDVEKLKEEKAMLLFAIANNGYTAYGYIEEEKDIVKELNNMLEFLSSKYRIEE